MATITEPRANNIHSVNPAPVHLNAVDWIALALIIIGAINWGLVGLFNFDLIAAICGEMTTASRVVYALVGLAALYGIFLATRLGAKNR